MPVDWFRPERWDDAVRSDFEAQLGRARRTSRQQYLYLAGVSLKGAGEWVPARALLERALEDRDAAGFFDAEIRECLGDLAVESCDRPAAEGHYRAVLAAGPAVTGTSGAVELSLAEVLMDDELRDRSDEAEAWVQQREGAGPAFDASLFRGLLLRVRISERRGDGAAVRQAAAAALEVLGRGPALSRHRGVGLASTGDATAARLRALADLDA